MTMMTAEQAPPSSDRTVAGASHAVLLEDKGFAQITSRAITEVVHRVRWERH